MEQDMKKTQVSIKGIIIPASWDTDGSTLTTAIVTFDEDIFVVEDTLPGRTLPRHLRQTVIATGFVVIHGDSKTIQVTEYSIHGPGDPT